MTEPRPEKLEREKDFLYVTDAQLMRRLGLDPKIARPVLLMLDAQKSRTGFPQPSKLWGNRRYWPAVKAWLDRSEGVLSLETIRDRKSA